MLMTMQFSLEFCHSTPNQYRSIPTVTEFCFCLHFSSLSAHFISTIQRLIELCLWILFWFECPQTPSHQRNFGLLLRSKEAWCWIIFDLLDTNQWYLHCALFLKLFISACHCDFLRQSQAIDNQLWMLKPTALVCWLHFYLTQFLSHYRTFLDSMDKWQFRTDH